MSSQEPRAARRSYFEHYVGSATVALILQTRASDLPTALNIVKRVREFGYYMKEAGSRAR